jgi:hypothetical protein
MVTSAEMTALTPTERQMVIQLVMDRWNPRRQIWKLGNHHGLSMAAVERIMSKESFRAEVSKQQAISEGRCADLTMEDRRRRVADISDLVQKIPAKRVRLRMKLLDAIRREVGDSRL